MDFRVSSPLEIKQQAGSDFCLGCVISSIGEEYANEPCEEAYSFAAGRAESGQPLSANGLLPKAALMGAIKHGVLPKRLSPYSIATHGRDFCADWNNWKGLEHLALKPFQSFYRVSGYEATMLREQTSLIIGLFWEEAWDKNPVMTPPDDTWNHFEPHEIRAIGMKDGRMVLQNSRGADVGDKGVWYMSSEDYTAISHAYRLSHKPWPNLIRELIERYL